MDKFKPRRRLLQGSLAAPLVLTVASPSALAASSFQVCLDRAKEDRGTDWPAFVKSRDDRYRLEVSIYRGKLKSTGTNADYYESGGRYFPVNSCYKDGYTASSFTGNTAPAYLEKRWGLVLVDSTGKQVGFGPCTNGGFSVSQSCWTSFKAG